MYAVLIVVTALVLIFHTAPRFGNKNVLVYITICSTLGSFTVMGCKGVGVGLKQTFQGNNQFTNWIFYVLLVVVVACILVQLNYLNRALDIFNTAVVTPIYYVFFTSLVIVASLILFKEWGSMSVVDIIGDLCGFLTIIAGIFLLNAFKDMNVSWRNLTNVKRECGSLPDGDQEHLIESGPLEAQLSETIVTDYQDSLDEFH